MRGGETVTSRITKQNLSPNCRQARCIVGNVGIPFSHGKQMIYIPWFRYFPSWVWPSYTRLISVPDSEVAFLAVNTEWCFRRFPDKNVCNISGVAWQHQSVHSPPMKLEQTGVSNISGELPLTHSCCLIYSLFWILLCISTSVMGAEALRPNYLVCSYVRLSKDIATY